MGYIRKKSGLGTIHLDITGSVHRCTLLSPATMNEKAGNPTGLGSVSEVVRFDGAYEIACIKHTGWIF